MKLKTGISSKTKLSSTLKSWFPLLQSSIGDLEKNIEEFSGDNPFINVTSNIAKDFSSNKSIYKPKYGLNGGISEKIESLSIYKESLSEKLISQITPPLFPTASSVRVAEKIVENINDEGYFEGDSTEIAKELGIDEENVEKIRGRFAYLEPSGVGARDLKESFLFQLTHLDIDDELFCSIKTIIDNLEAIKNRSSIKRFSEAQKIIKSFKNPPAIEYLPQDLEVIPDIFVFHIEGNIEVRLNDSLYPIIEIENVTDKALKKEDYIKSKLREAKDLIDALEMRKATLYKIGLMLVEYQYDFFLGGAIRPMKLKDLAEEFGHAPSTISRAIQNKYLECNRGVIPLKSFFNAAIDEDVSNAAIKEFIEGLIKNEDKKKPMSDAKILEEIEKSFSIKMVRRTITKYRKQLDIASSSERKKLYEISV